MRRIDERTIKEHADLRFRSEYDYALFEQSSRPAHGRVAVIEAERDPILTRQVVTTVTFVNGWLEMFFTCQPWAMAPRGVRTEFTHGKGAATSRTTSGPKYSAASYALCARN